MSSVHERLFDAQPPLAVFRDIPEIRFAETDIRIGSTPADVLHGIVTLRPEITGINFMVYDEESNIVHPLSNNRKKDDFFFLESGRISEGTVSVAAGVLRHLPGEWGEEKTSWALAATSPVIAQGSMGWNHIPMMDFNISPDKENLKAVREMVLPYTTQGGCLLETPNGYHFYGFDLYGDKTWKVFVENMGRSGLANQDYIAFCLEQRLSALRVDSGKSYSDTPKVVEIFRPLSGQVNFTSG